jgi:hypothetical protein
MPMNMGNHITQGSNIDFIWMHDVATSLFYSEHERHQMLALTIGEISHLRYMMLPDHSTKTR